MTVLTNTVSIVTLRTHILHVLLLRVCVCLVELLRLAHCESFYFERHTGKVATLVNVANMKSI